MGNRQERKARKARQQAGEDVYVHLKPTGRHLAPPPLVQDRDGKIHVSKRKVRADARRYGVDLKTGEKDADRR